MQGNLGSISAAAHAARRRKTIETVAIVVGAITCLPVFFVGTAWPPQRANYGEFALATLWIVALSLTFGIPVTVLAGLFTAKPWERLLFVQGLVESKHTTLTYRSARLQRDFLWKLSNLIAQVVGPDGTLGHRTYPPGIVRFIDWKHEKDLPAIYTESQPGSKVSIVCWSDGTYVAAAPHSNG